MKETLTEDATLCFYEIISAHSAYVKERELTKKENKSEELKKIVRRNLSMHRCDEYSSSYSFCLSGSTIDEFESAVFNRVELEKNKRTENLISTEKYYKKLKHIFREKFPEEVLLFEKELKRHKENLENKKRKNYQKEKQLIALSPSFIRYFQMNFNCCSATNSSYEKFLHNNPYRESIDSKTQERLYRKLAYVENNELLTLKDIALLASDLKDFISKHSKTDINTSNVDGYIINTDVNEDVLNDKRIITASTINKTIKRFNTLHLKYEEIVNL